ncbi:unnamed protein product [Diatraea saccharalis]|uniref:DUF7869 domain-containing protein n=1 Tax=Diatraea saccharalis TaxID=40085 RepID=A0A9N9R918_9NEOP|nr:unnamed protein product [Diatraea saccharalis]
MDELKKPSARKKLDVQVTETKKENEKGNESIPNVYHLRNIPKTTYFSSSDRSEDFSADESEYIPSSQRRSVDTLSSLSSLGGDSPRIEAMSEKISRAPSVISNLSSILGDCDFVASPIVIYKSKSTQSTPSSKRHKTSEQKEQIQILDITLNPPKMYTEFQCIEKSFDNSSAIPDSESLMDETLVGDLDSSPSLLGKADDTLTEDVNTINLLSIEEDALNANTNNEEINKEFHLEINKQAVKKDTGILNTNTGNETHQSLSITIEITPGTPEDVQTYDDVPKSPKNFERLQVDIHLDPNNAYRDQKTPKLNGQLLKSVHTDETHPIQRKPEIPNHGSFDPKDTREGSIIPELPEPYEKVQQISSHAEKLQPIKKTPDLSIESEEAHYPKQPHFNQTTPDLPDSNEHVQHLDPRNTDDPQPNQTIPELLDDHEQEQACYQDDNYSDQETPECQNNEQETSRCSNNDRVPRKSLSCDHVLRNNSSLNINDNQSNPSTSTSINRWTCENDIENNSQNSNSGKKMSRKRKRDPATWNDRVNKTLKNSGKKYIGCRNKKEFPEKTMITTGCSCKKKCGNLISSEEREEIFKSYYRLGDHERQWQFIVQHTSAEPIKRMTLDRKNNRIQSVKYYLPINNTKLQVCRLFFKNTLNVTHQTIYTALEKAQSADGFHDQRGRHKNRPRRMTTYTEDSIKNHIELFPTIESHYVREKSQKLYLSTHLNISKMYRFYKDWFKNQNYDEDIEMGTLRQYQTVFNTQYNYSFFVPKKDLCGKCELYKQADDDKKQLLQEDYDKHIKNKERARKLKEEEKKNLDRNKSTVAIFDLEKVLSIPQSQVGIFHYKRKYPIYNFTVYNSVLRQGFCYVWHYQLAKRGAIEIGSCLWQFLNTEHERGIEHISFYSDGCVGQNKNKFIFALYLFAAAKLKLNITHRFFETGHGQSEADSMHSCVEREIKNKTIYTPDQMYALIQNAKATGNKFIVKEMEQSNFYDIKVLVAGKHWVRDVQGNKILWSKVMEVKVLSNEPKILRYKYDFDNDYSILNTEVSSRVMGRVGRGRKTAAASTAIDDVEDLKCAYSKPIPVTKALYNDLKSLCSCEAIPRHYHSFYTSLISTDQEVLSSEEEDE